MVNCYKARPFSLSIAIIGIIAMFLSCENDIEVVNQLTLKDETPFETSHNIELIYSENGKISLMVKAPLLERYTGEKNYFEMNRGIEVFFYDSLMNVTSTLTANYAISYEDEKITEARNNVVVVNEKNEQLDTEHLIWDEKNAIIYSEVFVKITTEKEVLYGDGFESDERFDSWSIKQPKGTFIINQDEEEDTE